MKALLVLLMTAILVVMGGIEPGHVATPVTLEAVEKGTTSKMDNGWPPAKHQGQTWAPTLYLDDVTQFCGEAAEGYRMLGCYRSDGIIALPNPCTHPEYAEEAYARLACHEIGHRNGWPGNHPRP